MSASKEKLAPSANVKKLGIIAGGGDIPKKLAQACTDKGIEIFIIAFEGQTKPETVSDYQHIWTSLGAAGHIIQTLKSHNIKDVVLIGGIRRPSLTELKPDLKGAEIIARIGFKSRGDNDALTLLKEEFEKLDINVHGIQSFMDDITAPKGPVGKKSYSKKHLSTIIRGVEIAKEIGRLDIGQAVIVQQDMVIGVESIEGTDELIRRCKGYMRKGEGGILVKMCKPNQNKNLD